MASIPTPEQIAQVVHEVRHQLLTRMGRRIEEASNLELYLAIAYSLREQVMKNWTASTRATSLQKARVCNYLSMEYLPGTLSRGILISLGAEELLAAVATILGRRIGDLLALEPDPGLGNGGLGRLASCILEGAATHHLPVRGYGLRYQYGIFAQEVWSGIQTERPDMWLAQEYPWEFRHDSRAVPVRFGGKATSIKNAIGESVDDLTDFDEVRALPFDLPIVGYPLDGFPFVNTMRLWSTKDSPRNFQLQSYNAGLLDQAAENTLLTDVLYPNDVHETGRRIRLKQEFLLVSASLQDIFRSYFFTNSSIDQFADRVRIQINDTHPALAVAELVRLLTKSYSVAWTKALELCQEVCGYTNHTLLKEALEEWEIPRMRQLLPRQTAVIEHINLDLCTRVRRQYPDPEPIVRKVSIVENQQCRMANLAIVGSHRVNGVAPLHSELLKREQFPEFEQLFPDRFCNITNGVSPRKWVLEANPELANLLTQRLGPHWMTDWSMIARLKDQAGDLDLIQSLQHVKLRNKEKLAVWLMQHSPQRDLKGRSIAQGISINPLALFDVQIKRLHEYKRQLMSALALLVRIQAIKDNPNAGWVPRVFLYGGKAAPGYRAAKWILQLLGAISDATLRDPEVSPHLQVFFLEDYDVSLASLLIPAADLSEQIPCPGFEASGTGNMKFAMNGALTIGSRDGANLDLEASIGSADWPFGFGPTAQEVVARRPHAAEIATAILEKHPQTAQALRRLQDGSLARFEAEQIAFESLYASIIPTNSGSSDFYGVLADLPDYLEAQARVDALYRTQKQWHRTALLNLAGTGPFSIDRTVRDYSEKVWHLAPVDVSPRILAELEQNGASPSSAENPTPTPAEDRQPPPESAEA
jgi:starch phosphorylase